MTNIAVQIATKFALKFSFIGVEKKEKRSSKRICSNKKLYANDHRREENFTSVRSAEKKSVLHAKKNIVNTHAPKKNFYQYRHEMIKKPCPHQITPSTSYKSLVSFRVQQQQHDNKCKFWEKLMYSKKSDLSPRPSVI